VPIVYRLNGKTGLVVRWADGTENPLDELSLDAVTSRSIFARDGRVQRVTVSLALV
jgi:hypothetical protein